jgi:hypothetical protein
MSAAMFRDPKLESQLGKDGYVNLSLLDVEAATALRAAYAELLAADRTPAAFKQAVFDAANRSLGPHATRLFLAHQALGATFHLLTPGQGGPLPLQQGPTLTDETRWRTLSLWIPLDEGMRFQIFPRSHDFTNALRGPTLPSIWRNVQHLLAPRMRTQELPSGQALVIDDRLLHAALPGAAPCLALRFGITHPDAVLCQNFHDAGQSDAQRIERYAVPHDFFLRDTSDGQRPAYGDLTQTIRQDLSPVSDNTCKALLMGIASDIYRPIQDASLLKAVPKSATVPPKFQFPKS